MDSASRSHLLVQLHLLPLEARDHEALLLARALSLRNLRAARGDCSLKLHNLKPQLGNLQRIQDQPRLGDYLNNCTRSSTRIMAFISTSRDCSSAAEWMAAASD